eukprot:g46107.t1
MYQTQTPNQCAKGVQFGVLPRNPNSGWCETGLSNANIIAMLGQTITIYNLYLANAESGCYAAYTKPCAHKSLADVASPCGKFSFQCSKSELADEAGPCSPIATTCAATTLASLPACAKFGKECGIELLADHTLPCYYDVTVPVVTRMLSGESSYCVQYGQVCVRPRWAGPATPPSRNSPRRGVENVFLTSAAAATAASLKTAPPNCWPPRSDFTYPTTKTVFASLSVPPTPPSAPTSNCSLFTSACLAAILATDMSCLTHAASCTALALQDPRCSSYSQACVRTLLADSSSDCYKAYTLRCVVEQSLVNDSACQNLTVLPASSACYAKTGSELEACNANQVQLAFALAECATFGYATSQCKNFFMGTPCATIQLTSCVKSELENYCVFNQTGNETHPYPNCDMLQCGSCNNSTELDQALGGAPGACQNCTNLAMQSAMQRAVYVDTCRASISACVANYILPLVIPCKGAINACAGAKVFAGSSTNCTLEIGTCAGTAFGADAVAQSTDADYINCAVPFGTCLAGKPSCREAVGNCTGGLYACVAAACTPTASIATCANAINTCQAGVGNNTELNVATVASCQLEVQGRLATEFATAQGMGTVPPLCQGEIGACLSSNAMCSGMLQTCTQYAFGCASLEWSSAAPTNCTEAVAEAAVAACVGNSNCADGTVAGACLAHQPSCPSLCGACLGASLAADATKVAGQNSPKCQNKMKACFNDYSPIPVPLDEVKFLECSGEIATMTEADFRAAQASGNIGASCLSFLTNCSQGALTCHQALWSTENTTYATCTLAVEAAACGLSPPGGSCSEQCGGCIGAKLLDPAIQFAAQSNPSCQAAMDSCFDDSTTYSGDYSVNYFLGCALYISTNIEADFKVKAQTNTLGAGCFTQLSTCTSDMFNSYLGANDSEAMQCYGTIVECSANSTGKKLANNATKAMIDVMTAKNLASLCLMAGATNPALVAECNSSKCFQCPSAKLMDDCGIADGTAETAQTICALPDCAWCVYEKKSYAMSVALGQISSAILSTALPCAATLQQRSLRRTEGRSRDDHDFMLRKDLHLHRRVLPGGLKTRCRPAGLRWESDARQLN